MFWSYLTNALGPKYLDHSHVLTVRARKLKLYLIFPPQENSLDNINVSENNSSVACIIIDKLWPLSNMLQTVNQLNCGQRQLYDHVMKEVLTSDGTFFQKVHLETRRGRPR